MPPASQIERSNPHGQRIILWRDSASMLSAHELGRMARKNL
jgi:hypothetical protein